MTYLELRKIYLDLRDSEDYITALYKAKDLYWNVLELIQDREELDKVLSKCRKNWFTTYGTLLKELKLQNGLCYLLRSATYKSQISNDLQFFLCRYPISLGLSEFYEDNEGVSTGRNYQIEELINQSIKSFKLRIELIDKLIIQYNTWKEKDKIH